MKRGTVPTQKGTVPNSQGTVPLFIGNRPPSNPFEFLKKPCMKYENCEK